MRHTTKRIKVRARRAKKKFRTLAIQIQTTMGFILGATVLSGILIGSGVA